MLLGFEKPSKGSIYYKGSPLTPDLVWKIRKEVSYISQDTDLGEGSVKALLEEIFSYHPNRGKDNPEKLKVSNNFHSDILDSTLYSFREAQHWLTEPAPIVYKPQSNEWFIKEAKEMEKVALKQLESKEEDIWGDYETI